MISQSLIIKPDSCWNTTSKVSSQHNSLLKNVKKKKTINIKTYHRKLFLI